MYAVGQKDGLIKLTDDGWTLDNLLSRGVDINKSKKRKTILINQLRGYGISFACKKLVLHVQHIWKNTIINVESRYKPVKKLVSVI